MFVIIDRVCSILRRMCKLSVLSGIAWQFKIRKSTNCHPSAVVLHHNQAHTGINQADSQINRIFHKQLQVNPLGIFLLYPTKCFQSRALETILRLTTDYLQPFNNWWTHHLPQWLILKLTIIVRSRSKMNGRRSWKPTGKSRRKYSPSWSRANRIKSSCLKAFLTCKSVKRGDNNRWKKKRSIQNLMYAFLYNCIESAVPAYAECRDNGQRKDLKAWAEAIAKSAHVRIATIRVKEEGIRESN